MVLMEMCRNLAFVSVIVTYLVLSDLGFRADGLILARVAGQEPDLAGLSRRLAEALTPFQHKYLTNLAAASGKAPPSGPDRYANPDDVWHAFRDAMDSALNDTSLHLNEPYANPRADDSIFISIASYRDPSCSATVRRAFERADRPALVNVGVVQQNCDAEHGCFTGTGWAETRRWVPSAPDPDCLNDFCASSFGKPHCDAGRVRVVRLREAEAYGPMFARFLNAKLWRGETYFMQIDSHSGFREGWDTTMINMIKSTPSHPNSVISNYPPEGLAEDTTKWGRAGSHGMPSVSGLCGAQFDKLGGNIFTLRMDRTSMQNQHTNSLRPPYAPFVAAGFLFAHASFLRKVPPDPFLPYVFMGEEIAMSLRLWTAGFDIYAPSIDVVKHEYVRSEHPKFWETVNFVFGGGNFHNPLSEMLVHRVLHLLGYKPFEGTHATNDVLTRISEYGLGTVRSREQFMQMAGLNVEDQRQNEPTWCTEGSTPPHAMISK
eukprot:TRINITY_DN74719_c0_g1_i1.p1 TRINITY_DN74719_c0_g1~~TRINITY_DN74719_c0_g1_i1.p1  ORF type:complete len:489 (-),score=58.12 TRINITY_DN74719_c0_g1_i1:54-1520(-)